MQSSSEQPLVGEERNVTSRITAAKETSEEAACCAPHRIKFQVYFFPQHSDHENAMLHKLSVKKMEWNNNSNDKTIFL